MCMCVCDIDVVECNVVDVLHKPNINRMCISLIESVLFSKIHKNYTIYV